MVAGCGAAGYPAAKTINNHSDFDVTAVDWNDFFEFKPALYGVIAGHDRSSIGFDLRKSFLRSGIDFVNERVTGIDPDARTVTTAGHELEYDRLFVGLGGEVIDFGIPQEEVIYLDSYHGAQEIRERALDGDSMVMIGGGVTGVETCFTVRELAPDIEITLIEAGDRVASQLHPENSERIRERLEEFGITVRTGERIESIEDGTVMSSERRYDPGFIVQATGVRPQQVVRDAFGDDGLTVDRHLQSTEHPAVFGAGDSISFTDQDKIRRAYHATREARTASINLLRSHTGKRMQEYVTREAPIILTLGGMNSLLQTRWFSMTGLIPHLMEHFGVEKRFIWKYKYLT